MQLSPSIYLKWLKLQKIPKPRAPASPGSSGEFRGEPQGSQSGGDLLSPPPLPPPPPTADASTARPRGVNRPMIRHDVTRSAPLIQQSKPSRTTPAPPPNKNLRPQATDKPSGQAGAGELPFGELPFSTGASPGCGDDIRIDDS